MNFDGQWIDRVLMISLFLFLWSRACHGWHQTLTFHRRSSYELTSDSSNQLIISDMKFFMWFNSYAIYGARETLIFLKPNLRNSTVEISSYPWPVDQSTMTECLEEWNTKDKCYNDIVHVRILPNNPHMDVYCTYAHRPMIRSFNLRTMSFLNEHLPIRDPHPPIDSESSYVMLTFNTNIITAGYQGDYIPTIRATQGKTLLYALRPNSYFIGGFKYDNKAVFGVIETSEQMETNRVSRLVMACANRTEIVRKAILNCSTDLFDSSHSFVFHILTALVDPIRMSNGSILLFTTFTTNNSSLTASAVCLFILDKQFYDVFTAPSKQSLRRSPIIANDLTELVVNCSQTSPSIIDRNMVESEKQFRPYLLNPLLIETMSTAIFTSINVFEYNLDVYCLILGTSDGRLITAFMDRTFQPIVFEELTLPDHMRYAVQSITYQRVESNSYAIIISNSFGYLVIKLTECHDKLCWICWTKDCLIKRMSSDNAIIRYQCAPDIDNRLSLINNQSTIVHRTFITPISDEQSNTKLLFYIVVPMSVLIFILSISIIILLTRTNRNRKSRENSSLYQKQNQQRLYPIKTEFSFQTMPKTIYSPSSVNSLPPLILPQPSPTLPTIPSITSQTLSVERLYRSYV